LAPIYAFAVGFVIPAVVAKMIVEEPLPIASGLMSVTARAATVGARLRTLVVGLELTCETEIAVAAMDDGTVVPRGNVTVSVPPIGTSARWFTPMEY